MALFTFVSRLAIWYKERSARQITAAARAFVEKRTKLKLPAGAGADGTDGGGAGDDAAVVEQLKAVTCHANEAGADGVALAVRGKWSLARLTKRAGKACGVRKAKALFLEDGSAVTGVGDLPAGAHVYVSAGKPFYKAGGRRRSRG